MEEDLRRLQRMFRSQKVLDMRTLGGRFPSRSRRSLFRDLAGLRYLCQRRSESVAKPAE
jgi:hypothetical protein